MRRLPLTLLATLLSAALAGRASLPPVPHLPTARTPTAGALRTCTRADLRLTVDAAGRVRFLEHGHRFPDNALRVRQSYDRAGRLTGIHVQWSGFAGQLLNVRGSFDARGRLVKESGYRRAGVTTPLRSYLRAAPGRVKC